MELGAEINTKVKKTIKKQLQTLGCYVDDELPEYIMVMIANKRTKEQMVSDLNLFLSDEAEKFVSWLFIVLARIQKAVEVPDIDTLLEEENKVENKSRGRKKVEKSDDESYKKRKPSLDKNKRKFKERRSSESEDEKEYQERKRRREKEAKEREERRKREADQEKERELEIKRRREERKRRDEEERKRSLEEKKTGRSRESDRSRSRSASRSRSRRKYRSRSKSRSRSRKRRGRTLSKDQKRGSRSASRGRSGTARSRSREIKRSNSHEKINLSEEKKTQSSSSDLKKKTAASKSDVFTAGLKDSDDKVRKEAEEEAKRIETRNESAKNPMEFVKQIANDIHKKLFTNSEVVELTTADKTEDENNEKTENEFAVPSLLDVPHNEKREVSNKANISLQAVSQYDDGEAESEKTENMPIDQTSQKLANREKSRSHSRSRSRSRRNSQRSKSRTRSRSRNRSHRRRSRDRRSRSRGRRSTSRGRQKSSRERKDRKRSRDNRSRSRDKRSRSRDTKHPKRDRHSHSRERRNSGRDNKQVKESERRKRQKERSHTEHQSNEKSNIAKEKKSNEDVRNVVNSLNANVDQTGKPVASQVKIHTNFKRPTLSKNQQVSSALLKRAVTEVVNEQPKKEQFVEEDEVELDYTENIDEALHQITNSSQQSDDRRIISFDSKNTDMPTVTLVNYNSDGKASPNRKKHERGRHRKETSREHKKGAKRPVENVYSEEEIELRKGLLQDMSKVDARYAILKSRLDNETSKAGKEKVKFKKENISKPKYIGSMIADLEEVSNRQKRLKLKEQKLRERKRKQQEMERTNRQDRSRKRKPSESSDDENLRKSRSEELKRETERIKRQELLRSENIQVDDKSDLRNLLRGRREEKKIEDSDDEDTLVSKLREKIKEEKHKRLFGKLKPEEKLKLKKERDELREKLKRKKYMKKKAEYMLRKAEARKKERISRKPGDGRQQQREVETDNKHEEDKAGGEASDNDEWVESTNNEAEESGNLIQEQKEEVEEEELDEEEIENENSPSNQDHEEEDHDESDEDNNDTAEDKQESNCEENVSEYQEGKTEGDTLDEDQQENEEKAEENESNAEIGEENVDQNAEGTKEDDENDNEVIDNEKSESESGGENNVPQNGNETGENKVEEQEDKIDDKLNEEENPNAASKTKEKGKKSKRKRRHTRHEFIVTLDGLGGGKSVSIKTGTHTTNRRHSRRHSSESNRRDRDKSSSFTQSDEEFEQIIRAKEAEKEERQLRKSRQHRRHSRHHRRSIDNIEEEELNEVDREILLAEKKLKAQQLLRKSLEQVQNVNVSLELTDVTKSKTAFINPHFQAKSPFLKQPIDLNQGNLSQLGVPPVNSLSVPLSYPTSLVEVGVTQADKVTEIAGNDVSNTTATKTENEGISTTIASTIQQESPTTPIEPSAPTISLNAVRTIQERCAYWPDCKRPACNYVHPSVNCKSFPSCSFGARCLYIHPPCKFAERCTNADCPFTHNRSKPTVPPYTSTAVCKFSTNCTNKECLFLHPVLKPCRFGSGCTNPDCLFIHENRSLPGSKSESKHKWIAEKPHISDRKFAVHDAIVLENPITITVTSKD